MTIEIIKEDEYNTLDILNDIYGDKLEEDTAFDFVTHDFFSKKDSAGQDGEIQEPEPAHPVTTKKALQFYPLNLFSSAGYSAIDLLDLSKISYTSGSDFNLQKTQFYKTCIQDQSKLFKSTDNLDAGEEFAIRSSCISETNPPVYMKYYIKDDQNDEEVQTSLLAEPIHSLFKKIFDKETHNFNAKGGNQERLFRRKRKRSKSNAETTDRSENWVSKYKPEYFSDLLTSENVNLECLRWLSSWKCSSNYLDKYEEPEHKILLIGGPPGVGKTSLVNVIAKHCGYNVVEINSSDDRTKGRAIPIINGVISAGSVVPNKPNLCLLEDVDTLFGSELQIISYLKQISSKKHPKGGHFIKRPIICTCIDVYSRQLKELRDVSKVVIIDTCDPSVLQSRIEWVLDEEGIYMADELIKEILETYRYDIRSCLTSMEFITTYSGKYGTLSLSHLTKDGNEGVSSLLNTVFSYHKSHFKDLETKLTSTVNTIGYNYTASAICENVTTMPMKRFDHLFKLSVFEDIMAQSDVVYNRPGNALKKTNLLNVGCSFLNKFICNRTVISTKFVYPQKTGYHTFNMRFTKSKNLINSIQKGSMPMIAQGTLSSNFGCDLLPFILSFLSTGNKSINNHSLPFVLRVIKGLDGSFEGLFPYGSIKFPMSIYPLLHCTQILVLYGISIVTVNQSITFDPPVFDLYLKTKDDYFHQIPERFSQLMLNFMEFFKSGNKSYFVDDTHFTGSSHFKDSKFVNFFEAVKFIYNNGFEAFRNLKTQTEKEEIKVNKEILCKRTHQNVIPILFSQILLNDSSMLKEFASKKKKLNPKTWGNYKYQDQNCSAVRYVINQL
ncbi:Rad17 cell cycle checkpoint family protein [Theileria parva strain Muguga]|uniref:Rad17 cell cycle checkpoint family protein n=1 Tax=Theileria parva strain Muguga TaxID=333668 RepID=UPI001C61DEA6|nr:Rad17 cell cycle checkpoint family protein [Theileria parva strain Muguga]KAF5153271.1 Rad17 cell cycle checkpoint family protein [Theileria parva strain Muguga]